ncbi:hypothetical protein ACO3VM_04160 [Methanocaldococcus sp. 10A]
MTSCRIRFLIADIDYEKIVEALKLFKDDYIIDEYHIDENIKRIFN